jgi:hypothetical protein
MLKEIFDEYVRMRRNGLDPQATFQALRPYIEPLADAERQQLARQIREWEQNEVQALVQTEFTAPPKAKSSAIRSIKPIQPVAPSEAPSGPASLICSYCGKPNRADALICYKCGTLLEAATGRFETKHFNETGGLFSEEYYGAQSALMLEIPDIKHYFEIQPQKYDHELIIGRSTANSPMKPDIDLADYNGGQLGVSRLHLALQYRREDNLIMVYDLGSANGSFINGQRLHPKEARLLRHGDQLRLGHFVMRVHFRHPMKK